MNKIALVTGGSRGLGKDMAIALAKKNVDVIFTYRDNSDLAAEVKNEITATGGKAEVLRLDVSDINGLPEFIEQLKQTLKNKFGTDKLDYVINNAGSGATIPMTQVRLEQFDKLLNEHFRGVYFLTQKCLEIMNDGGGVVFISSGTTRFSNPGYSVYASMKGAIEVLSRYVAKEFGSRRIRANVVAPGPIETDFNNAAIRNNPTLKSNLTNMTALGRVGRADDIGSVVAFLCSEESKWVNGQRIEVSGGINV